MVVQEIFLFFLFIPQFAEGLQMLPLDSCHTEHLQMGRLGCKNLNGYFEFTKSFPCNPRLFKDAVRLDGAIHFIEGKYADPMTCMPGLEMILVPEEDYFKNIPALKIGENVTHMEKFSYNTSTVIYHWNSDLPELEIASKDYEMDRGTFLKMAAIIGSKKMKIRKVKEEGECSFPEDKVFLYLSALDPCLRLKGNLHITDSLIQTKTKTRLINIQNGCVIIENSTLRLDQIYFIRKLKEIRNCSRSIIIKNKALCFTKEFVDSFVNLHINANQSAKDEMRREMLEKNGNQTECEGICTAEDLDKQTNCKTVWGDLLLKSIHTKKLRKMTTIYGRLIIDGFHSDEPFQHLPSLQKIISITKDPPIKVTSNTILRKINFPKNLTILSAAPILIYVDRNHYYRTTKKEFDELAEKYTAQRLNIKHLGEHECYFTSPISDFAQLEGCSVVVGDLEIDGEIKGAFNETVKLRFVTGCIRINGTNLSDLEFIRFLDDKSSQECRSGHVITNNKNLCANIYIKRLSTTRGGTGFFRITTYNNKLHCFKTCVREDVYQGRLECPIVDDRLMVPIGGTSLGLRNNFTVSDATTDFLSSAMNVERMRGTLSIRYTNLTRINTFSHLKEIEIEGDEPAIEITDNENLRSISFPNLKKIKAKNKTSILIVVKNNGKYIMPPKQYKQLVKEYGEERLDIEQPRVKGTVTTYDYGIWLGLAIGGIVGILCLIAVLSFFLARVISSKRKKAAANEQEPLIGADGHAHEGNAMEGVARYAEQLPVSGAPGDYQILEEDGNVMVEDAKRDGQYVTARTAMLGNRYDGGLKDNASVMKQQREANGGMHMDEEEDRGPRTAATARLGGQYHGGLRDNASAMQREKEGSRVLKSDEEDERGPRTAATARLGGKYDGALKDNASVWKNGKNVTTNMDEGPKDVEEIGPVTARTANIGRKFVGAPKENMSQWQPEKEANRARAEHEDRGPATAMTANIGRKFSGAPRENVSVAQAEGEANRGRADRNEDKGAMTAMTANLGGKYKFSGAPKENVSVANLEKQGNRGKIENEERGPATAMTANIGGKYDGQMKDNRSVFKNNEKAGAVTAKTGYVAGNKRFSSDAKTNKSAFGKTATQKGHGPMTANTAMIGAGKYNGDLRDNGTGNKGAVTAKTGMIGHGKWTGGLRQNKSADKPTGNSSEDKR